MRGRRTDANHASIRTALRQCGWLVADLSAAGKGFPDLVAIRGGRTVFVEVKDGKKSPSARKLTPAQVELHEAFQRAGHKVQVITDVDQVATL